MMLDCTSLHYTSCHGNGHIWYEYTHRIFCDSDLQFLNGSQFGIFH